VKRILRQAGEPKTKVGHGGTLDPLASGVLPIALGEATKLGGRMLGGGEMGDMGKPLPASRLAVLPATAHTAVITQPELLLAFIEPFLKGVTPKGMF
jgi:hypothetical protein